MKIWVERQMESSPWTDKPRETGFCDVYLWSPNKFDKHHPWGPTWGPASDQRMRDWTFADMFGYIVPSQPYLLELEFKVVSTTVWEPE